MTLEIRPVRDEELADFIFANAYAFNQDRRPEALAETVARSRAYVPLEWSLAGFLDGRLVAGMRIIPLTMRIDGAPLAMAAIGGVASLPEHRRRGHVGALLKRARISSAAASAASAEVASAASRPARSSSPPHSAASAGSPSWPAATSAR